ncbi:phenylacetate--CoA ligase family protein [Pseudorhodoplanes sinuspersici]|uniref:CoF synthetase n=1 Tax=Pseudorhodoplanes sinuspersici TaxID=1235591 RepID=A0A1W6ZUJ9_9HYPH|nr:phenylacetate--CoA ligase family protein [Pseudorhodoplanes sinuspersici]ARQ01077.1 CoF synthetase [Pseudorhodoplanes sinuspersici]RKE72723.1 phenylacetate-coenzyme A ligase PaaK-like adenylate-forming protein [Pseudorhodoplanes sinuspersici]
MGDSKLSILRDARRATKSGPGTIERLQTRRLQEMVAYARAHSSVYRTLYRDLPDRVDDLKQLPVTDKKTLMSQFNAWVADPAITIDALRSFVDDPKRAGEPFLGRYTIATTSGTTGARGIFVLDERSMAVTNVMALRMLSTWLGFGDVIRILAGGVRMAMVMAGSGHSASAVAAAKLRKAGGWRANRLKVVSADTPMPQIVAALNEFQPVVVAPYASMAAMLADEQEAGRLRIKPVLLALAAEGLPEAQYGRIARVFGAHVGNSYAATECPYLSHTCEEGWLHVNSDWVCFEPVDENFAPVPRGQASHTVLISNLANRTQPVLRYDLGDSVVERPDRCPCGSPFPAIKVQGRSADVMSFPGTHGGKRAIPPLAFSLLLDGIPGIEMFQIVQSDPTRLRVRFVSEPGVDSNRIWRSIEEGLAGLLSRHGLADVSVERGAEPPEKTQGGKYRRLIPFSYK